MPSLESFGELVRLQARLEQLKLALGLALREIVEVVVLRRDLQQPFGCGRKNVRALFCKRKRSTYV